MGRLKYFFAITNPLNAFTKDTEIQWAKKKMEDYWIEEKAKGGAQMTPGELKELIKAERIYNTIFHPDTKKKVPYVFRMCAFMPTNLPIMFGMLCVPQTIVNVVFWQWINQTYNACLNYNNRNATTVFTNKELGIAYTGAVTTSISIALIGRWLSKRFGTTAGSISSQRFRNGLVSLCALATAGFLNLFLIRYNEMAKGVTLRYKDKECGISKEAAKKAVISSACTRAVLPIPLTMLTPVLWKLIEILNLAPKGRNGIIAADMLILVCTLTVSMPLALSLFKQELTIDKDKVEPQFRNLKDENGNPITQFTFNKGL